MEQLFLLAEKITGNLKKIFSENREKIGIYSFDSAIIQNSSFQILFSNPDNTISIKLGTHHLDIPWHIEIEVENSNSDCKNFVSDLKQESPPYEVYPKLLQNPDTLGDALGREIAEDLIAFLEKLKQ